MHNIFEDCRFDGFDEIVRIFAKMKNGKKWRDKIPEHLLRLLEVLGLYAVITLTGIYTCVNAGLWNGQKEANHIADSTLKISDSTLRWQVNEAIRIDSEQRKRFDSSQTSSYNQFAIQLEESRNEFALLNAPIIWVDSTMYDTNHSIDSVQDCITIFLSNKGKTPAIIYSDSCVFSSDLGRKGVFRTLINATISEIPPDGWAGIPFVVKKGNLTIREFLRQKEGDNKMLATTLIHYRDVLNNTHTLEDIVGYAGGRNSTRQFETKYEGPFNPQIAN